MSKSISSQISSEDLKASEAYRARVHQLIPGGCHTYSKGDDQFPALSPAAIDHGRGAYVWDVDGNRYLDCSMGLTSVSLGHAYEPVLERVRQELERGVNFQRPGRIELEMAEEFLSLVPVHQMMKFAKNGSTATTAAVKLARAYTGRDLVAFPQEQPFFSYDDWFIGSTPCREGVPQPFVDLSVRFASCNFASLEELFQRYPDRIAAVVMEPERSSCPHCSDPQAVKNYLQKAIELTQRHGAVFVLDEMITGFKTDFPGSIHKYGLSPDLATWGKGIANGFSFCALTGRAEIMQLGGAPRPGKSRVFLVSTTHGGETHAIAAGLATIAEFKKHNVVGHNHSIGRYFVETCAARIRQAGLDQVFQVAPSDWFPLILPSPTQSRSALHLKSLLMQEMIRRGVLFQGAFCPCYSHTRNDVDFLGAALEESLRVVADELNLPPEKTQLIGPAVVPVFR